MLPVFGIRRRAEAILESIAKEKVHSRLRNAKRQLLCPFNPSGPQTRPTNLREATVRRGIPETISPISLGTAVEIPVHVDDPGHAGFIYRQRRGVQAGWPLQEIVHVICDDECVIFSCKSDQFFAPLYGHCLRRGIGEGRDGVDDMFVDFCPRTVWFELLNTVSLVQILSPYTAAIGVAGCRPNQLG